jgi:hypothetical protein
MTAQPKIVDRRRGLVLRLLATGALLATGGSNLIGSQEVAAARTVEVAGPAAAPAPAAELPGRKLGFVVTYFWYAMYQGADACPTGMAHVTTSKEFLATKPAAEQERLLKPENNKELYRLMDLRGPNGENLCEAPWAVTDAPMNTLSGERNDGLNLDGWDGTGAAPANVCRQKQYIAEDGTKGIDNQLGRVYACINGIREKGTLIPYFTTAMQDGMWSMLIEVSGVQDQRNDPVVAVDVYAGAEAMSKDANGKVLTHASLSPLSDPKFHRRLKGRIVDGVLETETGNDMFIPDTMAKNRDPIEFLSPRFKLTLKPDGTAEGLLGGYRTISSLFVVGEGGGEGQQYVGYQCEGMYHALRRYADGRRNSASGDCDTISAAFRVKAVPAFVVHPDRRAVPAFTDRRRGPSAGSR